MRADAKKAAHVDHRVGNLAVVADFWRTDRTGRDDVAIYAECLREKPDQLG